MRVVFAGTAAFARPSLDRLVDSGHDVALVVTQPDRPAGRGLRPRLSPVKLRATELGLPVYQPDRIRDPTAQTRLLATKPELLVVVAYGQILPPSLITAPSLGTLNVHASLLPRHRGPAPVEWAILGGDAQTGVTTMQMDAGVDTGPILLQRQVEIGPRETAPELEGRLAEAGARLLIETISGIQQGRVKPAPQPAVGATHARRLSSEDGKLDPTTMSSVEIDRRVRALSQRLGTWMMIDGVSLKVLRGHPDGETDDGVAVFTADGRYVIEEVQPPSGRHMSAGAWRRGRR